MKNFMNALYIVGVALVCTGVAFMAMACGTPRAEAIVVGAVIIMIRLVVGKEVQMEAERA